MKEQLILNQEMITSMQEDTIVNSNDIDRNDKLFRGKPFCVTVDPTDSYAEGFLPDPYFKLYNTNSVKHNSCVVRFALRDARIIYHKDGHRAYKINARLLRDVTRLLNYTIATDAGTITVLDVINNFLAKVAADMYKKYEPVLEAPEYIKAIGQYQPNKYGVDGELC